MRPTSIIVGQALAVNSMTGVSVEDCGDTAISVEDNVLLKGRDLEIKDCTTGFAVGDGCRLDLDGLDYDYRPPPRRVRRMKKKKG